MEKQIEPTPKRSGAMKNVFYIFLILFLIVGAAAIALGAYAGISAVKGVQSVTNPVGNLFRQLVVEATPVILPNPVVIVEEINSLARLETTSYSFQDIVQIERNNESFWGVFGESLLFVAYGDVIAGVDLAKLGPDDLQVESPTKVNVSLPQAEIFFSRLDNDRSYVANRDKGFLASADPQLETLVRQEAEDRMLEAAMTNGILDTADEEARRFLQSFLMELGFKEVVFVEGQLPAITPYVQEIPKGYSLTPAPPVIIEPTPAAP